MKNLSVIWGIAATFSILSAKAAQKCSRYLALPTDQVVKVEELRDRSWISASDSNIEAAGQFEKERKAKGETATQEELERVLGGSKVHLRQTTLPIGLAYVTIHKEDGTEIFDANSYLGLLSSNCGAIHDCPVVSTHHVIRDTPLGAGFTLTSVRSNDESFITTSTIQKDYDIRGQDSSVELIYSINPKPGSRNIDHLWLDYTERSFRTTIREERDTRVVQNIRFDFDKGELLSIEIGVALNLSNSKWESAAFDQVHLIFDPNGKLERITGISQSTSPNLAWSNLTDQAAFLDALKKGQNMWFSYRPEEPQAALIFKTVFGRNIGSLKGISFSAVKEIMDSARAERPLLVHSLLDLDPI
ncbi:MAG: hypothetical protein IPJ71_11645 [Bdellovibrionales bacterium]|nr:hypothetical protein [Bdellovibrionales bacterium]